MQEHLLEGKSLSKVDYNAFRVRFPLFCILPSLS